MASVRLCNLLFSRSWKEDYFVRSHKAMVLGGGRITLCDGWSQARNDRALRVRWGQAYWIFDQCSLRNTR
jgi:hypothetical protein